MHFKTLRQLVQRKSAAVCYGDHKQFEWGALCYNCCLSIVLRRLLDDLSIRCLAGVCCCTRTKEVEKCLNLQATKSDVTGKCSNGKNVMSYYEDISVDSDDFYVTGDFYVIISSYMICFLLIHDIY